MSRINYKLKTCVFIIRFITHLVLQRPFGNIIHDVAQKYDGDVSLQTLRRLEKLSIKTKKAELDLIFLNNCTTFNVYPKFVCFNIPLANYTDQRAIRKRLLKSAIKNRKDEKRQLDSDFAELTQTVRNKVSSLDWYVVNRAVAKNVENHVKSVVATHEKKLHNLTRNKILPLTCDEVITNISSQILTDDELEMLKNGLDYAIPPSGLNRTDIFATFELINRLLTTNIKDKKDIQKSSELTTNLSYLACNYYSSYTPNASALKKHGILKRLRRRQEIIIVKPDKGNGVVIMDHSFYFESLTRLISDQSKFLTLNEDLTSLREGSLQRFLRGLKKSGFLNDKTYKEIYPVGSVAAKLYGLPKMHKLDNDNEKPTFRPIISSRGAYNYNLAKFLSDMLNPHICNDYASKDTFEFVTEINNQSISNVSFLVSYDVKSLFTCIPLKETIEIAVDVIINHTQNLKISKVQLKKLFEYATSKSHFLFNGTFYDQIDGVSMGSPLAPTLANLFLGHHEGKWLRDYTDNGPQFYRRYVDDIIAVFNNEYEARDFLTYLNSKHKNIEFIIECEMKKLFRCHIKHVRW